MQEKIKSEEPTLSRTSSTRFDWGRRTSAGQTYRFCRSDLQNRYYLHIL